MATNMHDYLPDRADIRHSNLLSTACLHGKHEGDDV